MFVNEIPPDLFDEAPITVAADPGCYCAECGSSHILVHSDLRHQHDPAHVEGVECLDCGWLEYD